MDVMQAIVKRYLRDYPVNALRLLHTVERQAKDTKFPEVKIVREDGKVKIINPYNSIAYDIRCLTKVEESERWQSVDQGWTDFELQSLRFQHEHEPGYAHVMYAIIDDHGASWPVSLPDGWEEY